MLYWALLFLIATLVFGVLSFSGIAGTLGWIAFFIFAFLFLLSLFTALNIPPS